MLLKSIGEAVNRFCRNVEVTFEIAVIIFLHIISRSPLHVSISIDLETHGMQPQEYMIYLSQTTEINHWSIRLPAIDLKRGGYLLSSFSLANNKLSQLIV